MDAVDGVPAMNAVRMYHCMVMYLASTRMPRESYRRRLRPLLLCLCYGFRGANSLLCVLILHECSGLHIFFLVIFPFKLARKGTQPEFESTNGS